MTTNELNIILIIANLSLAVGTFLMAFYTRKSAQEMNLTRKESNKAHVIIHFKHRGPIIHLVVKNIGKTPAKNVTIRSDPQIKNSRGRTFNSLLEGVIPSFPPGFEITTFFDISNAYFNKHNSVKKYNVTINFINIYNEEIEEEYVLDLGYLQDTSYLTSESDDFETSLYNIKEELKKINNKLSK